MATTFRSLADCGNGETAEQQTQAVICQNGNRAKGCLKDSKIKLLLTS